MKIQLKKSMPGLFLLLFIVEANAQYDFTICPCGQIVSGGQSCPPCFDYYRDADGDGFGNPQLQKLTSDPNVPPGYSTNKSDCNDNDPTVYPRANELKDGKDNDCDGLIDEDFNCPTGGIIYVKADATGLNLGNSWTNAFTKLQDALETARRCGAVRQIWVAGGVYYPDEGILPISNGINEVFLLRDSVELYGSFAGTETALGQRNLANGISSILSGDIQQDGVKENNSLNLVWGLNLGSKTLMDGFIIEKAFSTFLLPQDRSMGMAILVKNSTTPLFRNLIIRNNEGPYGVGITSVDSRPTFFNCVLTNNHTRNGKGVVYNLNASPLFSFCSIAGNSNSGPEVVVMKNEGSSSPVITNVIIRGTSPSISGGTPLAIYSIIENPTVWPGTGNSNADPLFLNLAGGNLRLRPCSPAVNAGTVQDNVAADINGTLRTVGGKPDMGAYELPTIPVLYVNAAAPPGGDGSSWATALRSLQQALLVQYCSAIKEIWVARGTYYPDTSFLSPRNGAFTMRNNLAIYGGFAGIETQLSQRNWRVNRTTLSGDLGLFESRSDNSYNVISNNNNNLDNTAILDGFTIRGGQANGPDYAHSRGGGMFNLNSSPLVRNCIFTGNATSAYGGAVFNQGAAATPTFVNCVFSGNQASFGGAIYNESSQTRVINCTFSSNLVANTGAAMHSYGTPLSRVQNSIVWGNSNGISTSTINNSTPVEVTHSLVQGGYTGTGNINGDLNPLFVRQAAIGLGELGDLNVLSCSPVLNMGSNAALPGGVTSDLAGFNRVVNNAVDMGAYEVQTSPEAIVFVDSSATGTNEGTSWANAFTSLEAALNDINLCSGGASLVVYIAKGTYLFPAGKSAIIDNLNAAIFGGFPPGGGAIRDKAANPVIIKGEVRVLKNVFIDGVKVERLP